MNRLQRRLCATVLVLTALTAVLSIITTLIQYSQVIYTNGEETISDSAAVATPFPFSLIARADYLLLAGIGVYFAWRAREKRRFRTALMIYGIMWLWSLFLLAFKTTNPVELLTTFLLFSNFAPGMLCMLGLFFAAADEDLWPYLQRGLSYVILAVSVVGICLIPMVRVTSRASGRQYLGAVGSFLELVAFAPIYLGTGKLPRWSAYVPVVVAVICGVLSQTRLVFILLLVQAIAIAAYRRRTILSAVIHARLNMVKLFTGALVFVFVASALAYALTGPFGPAFTDFVGRLNQDTRSYQARSFFARVPLETLLLAKGYPTGAEPNSQGTNGIDLGYVNILYVGGLPALLSIVYFLVLPGLRLLRTRGGREVLEVGPVCLAAAVAFASSFILQPTPALLVVILCAGRAFGLLHGGEDRGSRFIASGRSNPWHEMRNERTQRKPATVA